METKEYRTVEKDGWVDGEWKNEPDKVQWPDPTTGLPCLIVRGPSGALCGYVGVPPGHPWHGKGYSDDAVNVTVHGGLTFAAACADADDESRHICHVAGPGEPDHVWWLGFDCAHAGDITPAYAHKYGGAFGFGSYESYKSLAYVRHQVTELAQQIATAT